MFSSMNELIVLIFTSFDMVEMWKQEIKFVSQAQKYQKSLC
jgi:hypothetical protein